MGVTWFAAEPLVLERERNAMAELAPEMTHFEDDSAGGWEGLAPKWPIPRPEPDGLDRLLQGMRLRLRVEYLQAYPAAAPILVPLEPSPPRERRLCHDWHLNGDGTLCLLASPELWSPTDTAADLVIKASGWFIEYLLKERGLIDQMSDTGLYNDASRDPIIAAIA